MDPNQNYSYPTPAPPMEGKFSYPIAQPAQPTQPEPTPQQTAPRKLNYSSCNNELNRVISCSNTSPSTGSYL